MTKMTKTLTAIAAAAILAVATVAAPQPAQARVAAAELPPASSAVSPRAPSSARLSTVPITAAITAPAITPQDRSITAAPAATGRHQRFWDGWGWHVRRVRVCD